MSPTSGPPRDASSGTPGERWPPRIQSMLDAKRLREQSASRASVAALWRKAVESAQDAEIPGLSIDGSLRAAYDAEHLAALALLVAHGLRPGGGPGHHEMTFAGASALGDPALADLVPDSEEVRGLRSSSMYDPVIAGAADRERALDWVRRTVPAIRAALVTADPGLASLLVAYS